MYTSRREFMVRLAASGAIVTAPFARSLGASVVSRPVDLAADFGLRHSDAAFGGVRIKIGYSAIAWHDQDAQAIRDVSELGAPGIQLRANALQEFPDPHALHDLLAQHHLTFVALSSGTAPLDPALRQSTIDTHTKNAKYLAEAGGSYLQIVPDPAKGRSFSAEDFKYEGRLLTEIGKIAAAAGVQASLHNHMGTMGQTPNELASILDAADPRYVKLELDTAHYLQGGGDPAAAVHTYGKRLLFLHLKDVKNAPTKSGYEFVELGQGRVNFPAIFEALKLIHFHGWGIIELDGARTGVVRTPMESARISKNYLEQTLGVHV